MQYPTEIKLKLNLLCNFKGNRKIDSKIAPVTFYKHRKQQFFWNFLLDQISHVNTFMLYNILEGRGISEGDELWKCPS